MIQNNLAVINDWFKKQSGLFTQLIDPLISKGLRVAIVDYPLHSNIGDLVIAAKTNQYLTLRESEIVFLGTGVNFDFSDLAKSQPDIIVLLGGGNFGDLWKHHQILRNKLITTFQDTPIVQFPQSIYFGDLDFLKETQKTFDASAKNFHLICRDLASFNFAKHHLSCSVYLSPDTATFMGKVSSPHPQVEQELLILKRNDKETLHYIDKNTQKIANSLCLDWPQQPLRQIIAKYHINNFDTPNHLFECLNKYFNDALALGLNIMQRADLIVTDRLHAAILGLLAGKTVHFVDNSYKKISAYFDTWGTDDLPCRHFLSFEEAVHFANFS